MTPRKLPSFFSPRKMSLRQSISSLCTRLQSLHLARKYNVRRTPLRFTFTEEEILHSRLTPANKLNLPIDWRFYPPSSTRILTCRRLVRYMLIRQKYKKN